MTLRIEKNADFAVVIEHVRKCASNQVLIDGDTGVVNFPQVGDDNGIDRKIYDLVNSHTSIILYSTPAIPPPIPMYEDIRDVAFGQSDVNDTRTMGDIWIYPPNSSNPVLVMVLYDAQGSQRDPSIQFMTDVSEFPSAQGMTEDIILAHLLAHVWIYLFEHGSAYLENRVIDFENDYRTYKGYLRRTTSNLYWSFITADQPNTVACFISTAAYGSPLAPEVQLLRDFRDNVLRRTRAGKAFIDNFYEYYRLISPFLVAEINRSKNIKRLAQWTITPSVRYCEIAMQFPDASIDQVPEPWRSFLEDTREKLEDWTEQVDLPIEFHDMPTHEAIEEIAIVLRYLLRTEKSRDQYLSSLATKGEIPFKCNNQEYEVCLRQLRHFGRSDKEIDLLVIKTP